MPPLTPAGNEFCERLAFYGLAANLSIYLIEVMHLSDSAASIQVSLFTGTAYLTPLLGAWLADGYWGRFKTILVFSLIYAAVRLTRPVGAWLSEPSFPRACSSGSASHQNCAVRCECQGPAAAGF